MSQANASRSKAVNALKNNNNDSVNAIMVSNRSIRKVSPTYIARWCNGEHAHLKCVNRELKPWSSQTKNYKISICCFSAKYI